MILWFILDMRRDVQEIFRNTPHHKQVMMYSATLSKEIRPVCKKFMQNVSYFVIQARIGASESQLHCALYGTGSSAWSFHRACSRGYLALGSGC